MRSRSNWPARLWPSNNLFGQCLLSSFRLIGRQASHRQREIYIPFFYRQHRNPRALHGVVSDACDRDHVGTAALRAKPFASIDLCSRTPPLKADELVPPPRRGSD